MMPRFIRIPITVELDAAMAPAPMSRYDRRRCKQESFS
jgi:hypothetical protein